MKIIIIVLVIIFCSGCYQRVDKYDIEAAENFCSDKGGIYDIKEFCGGVTAVECMQKTAKFPHGKEIDKDVIKIKAEYLQRTVK